MRVFNLFWNHIQFGKISREWWLNWIGLLGGGVVEGWERGGGEYEPLMQSFLLMFAGRGGPCLEDLQENRPISLVPHPRD